MSFETKNLSSDSFSKLNEQNLAGKQNLVEWNRLNETNQAATKGPFSSKLFVQISSFWYSKPPKHPKLGF